MKAIYLAFILLLFTLACNTPKPEQSHEAYEEQIIFPLQSEHTHGPTVVELPNGDMLSAWFQGSGERWADDVKIMGARLIVGDSVWSEPFLMADVESFPDINPMLFMDTKDRLWLMWYPVIANQWETSLPMFRISNDYSAPSAPNWDWQDIILAKPGNKTERGIQPDDRFVEAARQQLEEYETYMQEALLPQLDEEMQNKLLPMWEAYKAKIDSLAKGENMLRSGRIQENGKETSATLGYPLARRIGWQTKNKPFILEERLIVPLYSDGLDCSLFAISDDWGETWQFSNPVMGGIGIQPTIAIKKDGTLVAYLRDNGPPPQRMQRTESTDQGLTWSIAKDTELPNPGAGFDMVTLNNGDWLMVFNNTEDGRHDLTVAISDDEGESWPWKKQLEYDDRGTKATASHYPAVIQGNDGRIHTVYSYFHNDRNGGPHKTIKYASFPVSWVQE